MRVEADSISSHVAAIVAFEASGLRALSSLVERNGCNGFWSVRVVYHFACPKKSSYLKVILV